MQMICFFDCLCDVSSYGALNSSSCGLYRLILRKSGLTGSRLAVGVEPRQGWTRTSVLIRKIEGGTLGLLPASACARKAEKT